MKRHAATIAAGILLLIYAASLVPLNYARQNRDATDRPPSADSLLGTDALGRDRLARLVTGSRVSLLLAPSASLLAALCGRSQTHSADSNCSARR